MGEDEAQQRYGKEFTIVTGQEQSRSRSKSGKKKGKKKKKKSSSSSSSSSPSKRSRSRSGSRKRLRRNTGFGRSTMEQKEDEKRASRKFQKKMSKGADAALAFMGMRRRTMSRCWADTQLSYCIVNAASL